MIAMIILIIVMLWFVCEVLDDDTIDGREERAIWQPTTLAELQRALQLAWCAETAAGEWSPDCPSMNQCAVTALVVQERFGGKLLRCPMEGGGSHYWNCLPDGNWVDLTAEQFLYVGMYPDQSAPEGRTREYVLSYPDTARRYELLKQGLATENGQ